MSTDPHGNCPVQTLGASLSEARGAIILIHGRGGSSEDILTIADDLALPGIAYIAPQAAGNSWYPYSFLAPREQNEPWLTSALARPHAIVQGLQDAGLRNDQIAVAGFSQGACLATEYVASYPKRYAALIAFTGGLIGPPAADLAHAGNLEGTPALFASGDPDPHVPWTRVQESADALGAMGANITLRRYPGRGHTISLEEVELARQMLQTAFH